mmetsp:Transcript_69353/g.136371  ORF Transcript_69353/g.136371 Transcript_69353/m.136371 type:complete len:135 (+) Transcript_69353:1935-2339(+)
MARSNTLLRYPRKFPPSNGGSEAAQSPEAKEDRGGSAEGAKEEACGEGAARRGLWAAAAAVAAPAGNETSEAEHTEQVNMLMKEQEAVAQSVRTRDTELALLLLAQGEAQPARKEGDEEAAASAVELVKEGAHI